MSVVLCSKAGSPSRSIFAAARSLDMASLEDLASPRLRGKSAKGGVPSALELERRCGRRLRQVRGADLLLGVYDVMRVADAEFGLQVSRDIPADLRREVSNFLKKPRPPTIMIAETKRLFDLGHILTSDTCLLHLRHTGGGHETPQVQGSAHFGTRYKCDSPQWSPCFFQIPYACFTIWCLQ